MECELLAAVRRRDPRNHTAEAVARLHRAIQEIVLPIIVPIGGRVAFEPYFPHVVGTLELAKESSPPFQWTGSACCWTRPTSFRPTFIPREDELRRSFRELGDRIQMVHLKDMKLNPTAGAWTFPARAAAR